MRQIKRDRQTERESVRDRERVKKVDTERVRESYRKLERERERDKVRHKERELKIKITGNAVMHNFILYSYSQICV